MKISTKGRYALRMMLDLALHYTGEYIPLKEIAARQDISEKYLEQLITQLNRVGLLKSTRGSQGGYMLSMDPSKITVGKILRVMEGNLSLVDCIAYGENTCPRAEICVTVEVWQKIQKAVSDVIDNITLEDLVNRYHEKVPMDYCI